MVDIQPDDLQANDLQAESSQAESSPQVTIRAEASAPEAGAPAAHPGEVNSEPAGTGPSVPEAAPPPPPATEPSVEISTSVPPVGVVAGSEEGEGGEFALLVEKLQQWWGSGELQNLWQQTRTPLTIGLGVIALLLVVQVYAGLLGAINSLPVVPGLLELVGVIWGVRYGLPKLIRRSERQQLLDGMQQRWRSFRGKA